MLRRSTRHAFRAIDGVVTATPTGRSSRTRPGSSGFVIGVTEACAPGCRAAGTTRTSRIEAPVGASTLAAVTTDVTWWHGDGDTQCAALGARGGLVDQLPSARLHVRERPAPGVSITSPWRLHPVPARSLTSSGHDPAVRPRARPMPAPSSARFAASAACRGARLFRYLRPNAWRFSIAMVGLVISSLIGLAFPLVIAGITTAGRGRRRSGRSRPPGRHPARTVRHPGRSAASSRRTCSAWWGSGSSPSSGATCSAGW